MLNICSHLIKLTLSYGISYPSYFSSPPIFCQLVSFSSKLFNRDLLLPQYIRMKSSETTTELATQNFSSDRYNSLNAAAKVLCCISNLLKLYIEWIEKSGNCTLASSNIGPRSRKIFSWMVSSEDARWNSPSHARSREMTCKIRRANGDHEPLVKDWISHFTRRNSEVLSITG